MNRNPLLLLPLALTLVAGACAEQATGPEDDDYDPEDRAAHYLTTDPALPTDPPITVAQTFWSCAGQAEGRFVDQVSTIIKLETKALFETNPIRQQQLFQQVAALKGQAKAALLFGLQQCAARYPVPRWFAKTDANGNLQLCPFTVEEYYRYLVNRHLEKT